MPKFKIHTPVRVEHAEFKTEHCWRIVHRIISSNEEVLFEVATLGNSNHDHTDKTSLFDQVAAAINYKYHKVQS